jgi:hypothetical protein
MTFFVLYILVVNEPLNKKLMHFVYTYAESLTHSSVSCVEWNAYTQYYFGSLLQSLWNRVQNLGS